VATQQEAGRPPGSLPPSLLTAKATIALAAAVAAAVLVSTIVLVAVGQHSFGYFRNDPAQTLGEFPLIGLMSQVGVLLAWAAAAICVFAGTFVARACGWGAAGPLLAFGGLVGYLAFDDLFLLHEDLLPGWLGISEELAQAGYAIAGVIFLWAFRDFLRRNEWQLLALALVVLGFSFAVDFDTGGAFGLPYRGLVEDSAKLFGLAFLAAYLVRLSARMLADAYPRSSSPGATRDATTTSWGRSPRAVTAPD
jgi:hypothetical protein